MSGGSQDQIVPFHPGSLYLWPLLLTAATVGLVAFIGAARTATWVPPPMTNQGGVGSSTSPPATTSPEQLNATLAALTSPGPPDLGLIGPIARTDQKTPVPVADVIPTSAGVEPITQQPTPRPWNPIYRLVLLPLVCALAVPWAYRTARASGRTAVLRVGPGVVVISDGRPVAVNHLSVSDKWRPLARFIGFGGRYVTVVATAAGIRVTVTGHVSATGYRRLLEAAASGGGSVS